MTFNKGDHVIIVKKCGMRFSEDETEEFYSEGEKYEVLDIRNGRKIQEDGSMKTMKGLKLKEDARLLVPLEAVKVIS